MILKNIINGKVWSENKLIDVVSAKDLHSELQVKTHFNRWFNRRIEYISYKEDVDYWKDDSPQGFDYLLTLDMAKELAILEKNSHSYLVRKKLIEKANDALRLNEYEHEALEEELENLKAEKRENEEVRLKNLLSTFFELHDFDFKDGLIQFSTKYDDHYDTSIFKRIKAEDHGAEDIILDYLKSPLIIDSAISLAEEIVGIDQYGWCSFV